MEAEIGVMLPQTKEDLRASETGRGEKEFSPRAFREGTALSTP